MKWSGFCMSFKLLVCSIMSNFVAEKRFSIVNRMLNLLEKQVMDNDATRQLDAKLAQEVMEELLHLATEEQKVIERHTRDGLSSIDQPPSEASHPLHISVPL
jgi:hypothetical protein